MRPSFHTTIAVLIGFLIGFGVALPVYRMFDGSPAVVLAPTSEEKQEMEEPAAQSPEAPASAGRPASVASDGENEIFVSDQLRGGLVAVGEVALAQNAWVVIHEDRGGEPGNVLGAARFDAGVHSGQVELLRPTEGGKTYYAMLHTDDGEEGFDLAKDAPLRTTDGVFVMAAFKALEPPLAPF